MAEYIYCKGCPTLISGCFYKDYNTDGECPCTICIVKPICAILCSNCGDYRIRIETND